jgi:hypothetical protein
MFKTAIHVAILIEAAAGVAIADVTDNDTATAAVIGGVGGLITN